MVSGAGSKACKRRVPLQGREGGRDVRLIDWDERSRAARQQAMSGPVHFYKPAFVTGSL